MATSSAISLELPSAQALQSTEQMKLLDAVDSLRALGLGEFTSLPQLVVCGDQSSGKSSVMEAISGVPFPRKDGVCTRFATEVILRRDRTIYMGVSIRPADDLPAEEQQRLKSFKHDIASKDDFASLFEKAKEYMRISEQKRFSKSVLRVEFRGPQQPQLTLVDLPGLIHATDDAQTKDDISLVKDLVRRYLDNPRSVILAVVSAKNDFNLQIITQMVRDIDPQGKRALGIITKPDAVGPNETAKWIKHARNEVVKFDLGWHVVKNLDLGKENASSRDEQEAEFFQISDFSLLPSQNTGITTLRTRLSKVLFHQIQTTLPKLLEDIENRIRSTKAARDRLGPSRSETLEQRSYLIELSQSFQTICQDAIGGHYDHEFFKEDIDKSKRLCANLINKHLEFAAELDEVGTSWKVADDGSSSGGDDDDYSDDDEEIPEEAYRTRKQAIKDACRILKYSRGSELPGLPNPHVVGELFRNYSRPWEGIARKHITDVWSATKMFLEAVLHHLADDDVCDKILRLWLDPLMDNALESANSKLSELLEVHKDHPMTLNHDFVENRRKLQEERAVWEPNVNMDVVAAEEAFDNMIAYYKVAIKLFMDYVPTLAIRAPIIKKIPGMLSPKAVHDLMNDNLVTKIAGESEDKTDERDETDRMLHKLQKGAQICREYAIRPRSSSRLAEESSNAAAERNPVESGAEKRRGRDALGRRRSPQHKPSSQVPPPANSSSTGGGGIFSELLLDPATPRAPSQNASRSTGLFFQVPAQSSAPTSSNTTAVPGTGLFGSWPAPFGLPNSTSATTSGTAESTATTSSSSTGGSGFKFFAPAPAPAFGSSPKPLFGSTSAPAPAPAFGSNPKPLFGSTSAPAPALAFGSNPKPLFGSTSAPAPAPAFGSNPKPLFDSTSAPDNGSKNLPRISKYAAASEISKTHAARTAPRTVVSSIFVKTFEPYKEAERLWTSSFQAITFNFPFKGHSFEEIRLADYVCLSETEDPSVSRV